MSKRMRQYIGILAALVAYYLVYEGAHLLYALLTGVFKQIRLMGLGVQIDVCAERMTDTQLGIFCFVGALATFCVGYLLAALARSICHAKSKLLAKRAVSLIFPILALVIGQFTDILLIDSWLFWGLGAVLVVLDVLLMGALPGTLPMKNC